MDGSIVFVRWRQSACHLTHASLDPPESTSQMTSHRFSCFCTAHGTLYNGPTLSPSKLQHCKGDLDSHLIHGFFSHPSPQPKQHLNQFRVFAGLTSVTDRPTDHATQSVTTGCIYVHGTAMRPDKTKSRRASVAAGPRSLVGCCSLSACIRRSTSRFSRINFCLSLCSSSICVSRLLT